MCVPTHPSNKESRATSSLVQSARTRLGASTARVSPFRGLSPISRGTAYRCCTHVSTPPKTEKKKKRGERLSAHPDCSVSTPSKEAGVCVCRAPVVSHVFVSRWCVCELQTFWDVGHLERTSACACQRTRQTKSPGRRPLWFRVLEPDWEPALPVFRPSEAYRRYHEERHISQPPMCQLHQKLKTPQTAWSSRRRVSATSPGSWKRGWTTGTVSI